MGRFWCERFGFSCVSEKPTTKICPNCGNTQLVLIQTQQLKLCSCTDPRTGEVTRIEWIKDEGQEDYY